MSSVPSVAVQAPTYLRGYGRIASRGRSAAATSASWSTTRASRAMSRSGEASSGLMSISLIQRCSTTSWLKRTRSCSRASTSIGLATADPAERAGDLRPLDHPPGERRVERRQGERPVPEELHELAAHPEQEHRAELRVDRRADDQLVAGVVDHRLDGHALEVLGAAGRHHRVSMDRQASRTASASTRFSATPPTSVLWVIVWQKSLTTTG